MADALSASIFIGETVSRGTAGSILFVDTNGHAAQNNAALFWDDANTTETITGRQVLTQTSIVSGQAVQTINYPASSGGVDPSAWRINQNGSVFEYDFYIRGGFYTGRWVIISGHPSGSGATYQINSPSLGGTANFMMGIWSDVDDACIQLRTNQDTANNTYLDCLASANPAIHRFAINYDGSHQWGVGALASPSVILGFQNDANALGVQNGTSPKNFYVYATTDSNLSVVAPINYERLELNWTTATTVCNIWTVKGGTGTVRALGLGVGGTAYLTIGTNFGINCGTSTDAVTVGDFSTGGATHRLYYNVTNKILYNKTSNDVAAYAWYDASGGAQAKFWYAQFGVAVGNVWRLRAVNDAENNGINAIVISRTGITSIDTIQLLATGVGCNTATPRRPLDALSTTGPQIRATYTDNSVYGELQATSVGNLIITSTNQVAFASAAKAAGDTTGYLMIPSTAGPPTGVPANIPTGQIAIQYDSTNDKLYFYRGGWKKGQVAAVDVIYA